MEVFLKTLLVLMVNLLDHFVIFQVVAVEVQEVVLLDLLVVDLEVVELVYKLVLVQVLQEL